MTLYKHVLFILLILLFIPFSVHTGELYEKPEIQKRMANREIISVVKVRPDEKNKKLEALSMDAVGLLDGVTIERAMVLMSDYENLERIAPDYIKLSELIIKKGPAGRIKKYVHMKTEVKTILLTYRVEVYARVREEVSDDKGTIHWEIIPAKTIGRKLKKEAFVGMKGRTVVKKFKRSKVIGAQPVGKGGHYRRPRAKKNEMLVLFSGRLSRKDMSTIVPNFMLQFAMEVALQRVGILLRNYLETAKEIPAQDKPQKTAPVNPVDIT